MKYADVKEVFAEIPDEITLAISVTGCPVRCPGCHSQYLWADTGEELTPDGLERLVRDHKGITCLCLMGGDQDPQGVNQLFRGIRARFPRIHTAWYSGRGEFPQGISLANFDYIKLGPWLEECGRLTQPTTNQRLYRIQADGQMLDITHRVWKKSL